MSIQAIDEASGDGWHIWNGDCIDVMRGLPDNSIGMSIFSPPYQSLYSYSNSDRDMGNCRNDDEFYQNFRFAIDELFRVLKSGRIVAVDCMTVPAMKSKDGYIGLKDFRGDLIREFTAKGFIWHSEHVMWKDPLIEATRTKALGLMHKQLLKDSIMSRAGIPQYLLAFRKPGENLEPVAHEHGVDSFIGNDGPEHGNLSHERWRRYASPVWMDINFQRTLNYRPGRTAEDEKHICPMALDIIERGIWLWSNPGDVILTPFMGIGSEVFCAVEMGRKGLGAELKPSYFQQAIRNLENRGSIEGDVFADAAE